MNIDQTQAARILERSQFVRKRAASICLALKTALELPQGLIE